MSKSWTRKWDEYWLTINKISIERMMNNIQMEPNSGCWLWTSQQTTKGYGRVKLDVWCKKRKDMVHLAFIRAHRAAYILFNKKPIPKGKLLCHRCDVKLCVNPAHLFVGTDKSNSVDYFRKKRIRDKIMAK